MSPVRSRAIMEFNIQDWHREEMVQASGRGAAPLAGGGVAPPGRRCAPTDLHHAAMAGDLPGNIHNRA